MIFDNGHTVAPTRSFTESYLHAWLKDVTNMRIAVCLRDIASHENIPVAESILVKNTVPKRQSEFIAGRICVHILLDKFGVSNQFIGRGPKGEPLLPLGFEGSISHDGNRAVAALTNQKTIKGIGLDLIDLSRINTDLPLLLIGTDSEITLVSRYLSKQSVPNIDFKKMGLILFSLKESAVKVISPNIDHYIDLIDLKLQLENQQLFISYKHYPVRLHVFLTISEQEIFTFAIEKREHYLC